MIPMPPTISEIAAMTMMMTLNTSLVSLGLAQGSLRARRPRSRRPLVQSPGRCAERAASARAAARRPAMRSAIASSWLSRCFAVVRAQRLRRAGRPRGCDRRPRCRRRRGGERLAPHDPDHGKRLVADDHRLPERSRRRRAGSPPRRRARRPERAASSSALEEPALRRRGSRPRVSKSPVTPRCRALDRLVAVPDLGLEPLPGRRRGRCRRGSARIASRSSGVSAVRVPAGARASRAPSRSRARTWILFMPIWRICSSCSCLPPSVIAVIAITAAMPKTMPSMVRRCAAVRAGPRARHAQDVAGARLGLAAAGRSPHSTGRSPRRRRPRSQRDGVERSRVARPTILPSTMRTARSACAATARIVGHQDDGVALGVEPAEGRHDLGAGLGIEVASRLVGEDQCGRRRPARARSPRAASGRRRAPRGVVRGAAEAERWASHCSRPSRRRARRSPA